ncbi:MAG TPA: polysaccharide biosynthesis/export family protein [Bryobacteraceae bacterium]|jgi:polysaccharide export outer membrane protein|nr:polysaccharide biosynthesis/export family protein [Bryobacteraceae bacterium]
MRSLLFLAISAIALVPVYSQVRPSLMEEVGNANLPVLKLQAGDLVAVSVYDAPELTRTVRVDPDGTIRLPLLAEGVKAAGLMPVELESELVKALKSGEILVDPVVKITVVEYHSRPISVMGAVRKPVTFQSDGSITLLDALSRAEGFTDDAGPEILVTQNDAVQHIAVKRLMDGADPALNLRLLGNEEIRVPVADKIFVLGNIRKPGAFPIRDPADKTVLKMVALSEGLMPFSQKIAYIVRRREGETAQEIPIELAKIMDRKSPDVPLEVGDILYVPDNKARRSTMSVLDRLAGFGSATASGLVIWH